uniref:Titan9 n=1 Tax=Glycine max TaxID=3847 RepID=C6TF79_SOYBN|nr:unknown [Glycine max]
MEILYSKLYDKYTKLKSKKLSDLDHINKEQEGKFVNYLTAAEELIEHLKSEKEGLVEQVNELRTEFSSLRAAKEKEVADYQKLLMEEKEKNEALSEEVEKLLKPHQERTSHVLYNNSKIKTVDDQFKANSNSSSIRMTRKHTKQIALEKEARSISLENEGNSVERESTPNACKETVSDNLLECRTKANDRSGIDLHESGHGNWLIQTLFEYALSMKLSLDYQADEYACLHCMDQAVTPSVYRGSANHLERRKQKQSCCTMLYL